MARSRRQATHHGYLVVNKPAGMTSHDVVARVRRLVGERRVGHGGTLDPMATGVLPVAVGLATRTVEFLSDGDKTYRATIAFGQTTTTDDREGEVVEECSVEGLDLARIEIVLPEFRGRIRQVPPMHSAIHVNGERLYALARKGEQVEVPARDVEIISLDVISWKAPLLTVDVTCSKGTYIRALARDIGAAVGTGAHLADLQRTRSGPFSLEQSLSLEELERQLATGGWEAVSHPPDWPLRSHPRLDLDAQAAIDWGHGKPVDLPSPMSTGTAVGAYDASGQWRGVGIVTDSGLALKPTKVIMVGE